MPSVVELVESVDAAFVETSRGLAGWEDPHPDRQPSEEEYSRVTNPQKYRILRARAEAWLNALAATGLAEVETDIEVEWEEPPWVDVVSVQRALPRASGAIPLVFGWTRSEIDGGVVIGVGEPTLVVEVIPDCGCDACDSGSQDILDLLDEYVLGVVTGEYRRLRRGKREITVYTQDRQGSLGFRGPLENFGRLIPGWLKGVSLFTTTDNLVPEGNFSRPERWARFIEAKLRRLFRLPRVIARRFSSRRYFRQVEAALAHPKGWHEVSGSSWPNGDPRTTQPSPR
ncbi:MAG: hypothetical protein F4Y27_08350 [Acidimicrobiaceae bacterium]|nr:hypothetical protein [Acidimicrobiaceae bacterium]MYG54486.1 hypothetical protein [Acidimicrobiaceae bacterium]MYJ98964.1 hypothetical protein [Acidimicrobiaceae bacterium]